MCRTAENQPSSVTALEQARNLLQYSKYDFEYKLKMWQLRNSPFGDANQHLSIKARQLQRGHGKPLCLNQASSAPRIVAMIPKAHPVSVYGRETSLHTVKRKSVLENVSHRKIGNAVKNLIKFFEAKI